MDEIEKRSRDQKIVKEDSMDAPKRAFEEAFRDLAPKTPEKPPKYEPKTPLFEPNLKADFADKKATPNDPLKNQKSRSKSSLRMKYEAEAERFKKREGDLEDIRRALGLSQRKVCQLLLVDPSAWSRWIGPKHQAPPHVYRALEWYLLLQKKNPEYKSALWLNTMERPQLSYQEIQKIKRDLRPAALEQEVKQLKKRVNQLLLAQIPWVVVVLYLLFT